MISILLKENKKNIDVENLYQIYVKDWVPV